MSGHDNRMIALATAVYMADRFKRKYVDGRYGLPKPDPDEIKPLSPEELAEAAAKRKASDQNTADTYGYC